MRVFRPACVTGACLFQRGQTFHDWPPYAGLPGRTVIGRALLPRAASGSYLQLLLASFSQHPQRVDGPSCCGCVPLVTAAWHRQQACVTASPAARASLSVARHGGITTLPCAQGMGHMGRMHQLLCLWADTRAADDDGDTALHVAAHEGCGACVLRLLAAGVSVQAQDNIGRTALHDAAKSGQQARLRALLVAGAAVGGTRTHSQCIHLGPKTLLNAAHAAGMPVEDGAQQVVIRPWTRGGCTPMFSSSAYRVKLGVCPQTQACSIQ